MQIVRAMSLLHLERALLGALLSSVAGCGGPSEPPVPPDLDIELTASPVSYLVHPDASGWPVADCSSDVTAKVSGGGKGIWSSATLRFFIGLDRKNAGDSIIISATEIKNSWAGGDAVPGATLTSSWQFQAGLPFEAELALRYFDEQKTGTREVSTRFVCGPTPANPPPERPSILDHTPQQPAVALGPGDTVSVAYGASSSGGLWVTQMTAHGAFDTHKNFFEGGDRLVGHTLRLPVPLGTSLGIPTDVTTYAIDAFGQFDSRGMQVPPLADVKPPVITQFSVNRSSGKYFVGDSIKILVVSRDNTLTHSTVWEVLPAGTRDSIVLEPYPTGIVELKIPVRPSWGNDVVIRVFVRDVNGNISSPMSTPPGMFHFYPSFVRPIAKANTDSIIGQLVVDSKRKVAYVQQSKRVLVLSLDDQSLTPLAIPGAPSGIDLTAGGDSLLVVLPSQRQLAVLDLRQSPPTTTLIPLAMPDTSGLRTPRLVAATSRGTAFVTFSPDPPANWFPLEVNLANGQQRFRSDAPVAGTTFYIGASANRSLTSFSGPSQCVLFYHAPSDVFSCHNFVYSNVGSFDATGSRFAQFTQVFDDKLALVSTLESLGGDPLGQAILAPDGATAYMNQDVGLVRWRTSDGAILDRTLPVLDRTSRIYPTPDGTRLLILGGTGKEGGISIVDIRDSQKQPFGLTASSLRAVAVQRPAPAAALLVAPKVDTWRRPHIIGYSVRSSRQ